jgi:TonB family protein
MNISLYILELSLILLLCHLIYGLSHKRTNQFNEQRVFILLAILSAVVIPFLPNLLITTPLSFDVLLPPVIIGGAESKAIVAQKNATSFNPVNLAIIVYIVVSLTLLIKVLFSLLKISLYINKGEKRVEGKQTIVFSEHIETPCSFFNYVFIPKSLQGKQEINTCIQHEKTHSELLHSIDKIVLQLLKAVLWWHPSIWYFTKQMDLVHEYQVDQKMTNNISTDIYQKVLLKFLLYPTGLRISNPFSSNIKKRIIMMNRFEIQNKPFTNISVVFALIFGILFIHACTDDQANLETETKESHAEKKETTPDSYQIEVIDTITTFDSDTYEESVKIVSSSETVYNVVDQMPVFPGCDESLKGEDLLECSNQKLMQFIFSNIKYPKAAQEKEIEGLVLVKFVVNTDGSIGHREFVRTLGHGMEETVDDMLAKMQKEIRWKPGIHNGKAVNVAFTLPVKFKLEE